MNVLIADDDAVTRKLLQHHLQGWGYQVTSSANGQDAWEIYQSSHFDLVILDWIMPYLSGPEVLKRIRESDGASDHCYVIFLTAKSNKNDVIACMDAGADDYLIKPFDKEELRARIQAGHRIVSLQKKLNLQYDALAAMNQKMQTELNAAANVQQALLPSQEVFRFGEFELVWLFQPCDQLAGDTLGIIPLSDQYLASYVLDVSGHGVSASLLSFAASYMLTNTEGFDLMIDRQSSVDVICAPDEVAGRLNKRFLFDEEAQQYFTMLYALLDRQQNKLVYVSAGHPPLLHLKRNGTYHYSEARGFPIGLIEDSLQQHELPIAPGDRVFMYSDGLTESLGKDRRSWGRENLAKTAQQTMDSSLEKAIAAITDTANEWRSQSMPADDISIIGIERKL